MFAGHLDFTPGAVGYNGKLNKNDLVDVPLLFGDISYRSTCVAFENKIYCVMPFRRVTLDLAQDMGAKVAGAKFFTKPVVAIIAQVIDRHNIIIEAYNYEKYAGDIEEIEEMEKTACASVGAMKRMRYVEKDVNVDYRGSKFRVISHGDVVVSLR